MALEGKQVHAIPRNSHINSTISTLFFFGYGTHFLCRLGLWIMIYIIFATVVVGFEALLYNHFGFLSIWLSGSFPLFCFLIKFFFFIHQKKKKKKKKERAPKRIKMTKNQAKKSQAKNNNKLKLKLKCSIRIHVWTLILCQMFLQLYSP